MESPESTTICWPVMDVFFAKVTNIFAQSSRSVSCFKMAFWLSHSIAASPYFLP